MSSISLPVFAAAVGRATVILALAGLVAAALRRSSASARHLVWVLGLVSALVVPALSAAVPKWELPVVTIAAPPVALSSSERGAVPAPSLPPEGGNYKSAEAPAPAPMRDPVLSAFKRNLAATSWNAFALLIWSVGAAIVLGRMLLGLVAVQWMSRRTRVVTGGPWIATAQGLAADLGVTHVRFVQSATASMPMAWGLFRASVLMPADADTWPVQRLRVVLLHELAHVKRRDCLTHIVAQIVCAAYWFNPLAWIAARHLRSERERACDDLVLAAGTCGADYADELLDIARVTRAQRFPAAIAGATVAMAHRSQLEGRLMAILDPSVPRRGLTRARTAAASAVFALLIVSVASVQPWAESRAVSDAVIADSSQAQAQAQATTQASGSERVTTSTDVQVKRDSATQTRVHSEGAGTSQDIGSAVGIAVGTSVGNAVGHAVGMAVGGMADGIADNMVDTVVDSVLEGVAGGIAGGIQVNANPNPNPHPNAHADRDDRKAADPRAVAALMDALKDSDKDVRETAMHALVQMRDPRMFEPLVAALKDASPDVREQAVFGLGQLRDPRAVDPLTTVLHDSNADVRQQAVFALGQLRDKRSVEPLISALKDENPDVRGQAAFALGQIRDGKAVEALVVALKDSNADVREQAAFALGQIGDPRAIDGLTAAMKDPRADVRQKAAFALGQIRY